MKYRQFIEDWFLIDHPQTGELVPFKFRPVQAKYYDLLDREYGIEKNGLNIPVRDIILKARREGFSSLLLALFAADDILSKHPTESEVISYKDDATDKFRRRYEVFITSYFKRRYKLTDTRKIFAQANGGDYILRHNGAHFYCGTASARTSERGGVLHKLLLTEAAHYPDFETMSAAQMIDGTIRQVDINAGWVFIESTANGFGNYYEQTWAGAKAGTSRFKPRFFGWPEMYTEREFEVIASEFTDKRMLKQEYPATPEEAFLSTGSSYFDPERVNVLLQKATPPKHIGMISRGATGTVEFTEVANGTLHIWDMPDEFKGYVIGGDVAEGIEGGDWSSLRVIEAESQRTVAKFKAQIPPDELAKVAYLLGEFYNWAFMGIEVNKDGLWVNSELVEMNYPNLYFQEVLDEVTRNQRKKYGWRTDSRTRPLMLAELAAALAKTDEWPDGEMLRECLTFVRNKVGRPEAMSGKNDDEIMAHAIALMIRHNAPIEVKDRPRKKLTDKQELWGAVERDLAAAQQPHDQGYSEE